MTTKLISAAILAATMLSTPANAGQSACCSPGWEMKDLKTAEALLDGICRGSSRGGQFANVGAARDVAYSTVITFGQCYSEPGWLGYQNGHKCKPGAIERKLGEARFTAVKNVLAFISGFDAPSMAVVTASILTAKEMAKKAEETP